MASYWAVNLNAWPGGLDINREGRLNAKWLTTIGRFWLRACERDERIVHSLFEKSANNSLSASEYLVRASQIVDMKAIQDKTGGWLLPRGHFLLKQLGLGVLPLTWNEAAYEALDIDDKNKSLALSGLLHSTDVWARGWSITDPDLFLKFAVTVLFEVAVSDPFRAMNPYNSPPATTPTPFAQRQFPPALSEVMKSKTDDAALEKLKEWADRKLALAKSNRVKVWKSVAEDYLRAAASDLLPQDLKEKCLPPAGLDVYVGREPAIYVENQVSVARKAISAKASFPFACLSDERKETLLKWVGEEAEKYCTRVDALLERHGAKPKRIEPTFARNLEWAVELLVLKWSPEKIAKNSKQRVSVVKAGIRKSLTDLGLSPGQYFDKKAGRRRKSKNEDAEKSEI